MQVHTWVGGAGWWGADTKGSASLVGWGTSAGGHTDAAGCVARRAEGDRSDPSTGVGRGSRG